MNEKDIKTMLELGEKDGKASAKAGPKSIADTFHYFALKKAMDDRVKGVNFDDFVDKKVNGLFDSYNILEDPEMQALFL